jgi:hypothetical protein
MNEWLVSSYMELRYARNFESIHLLQKKNGQWCNKQKKFKICPDRQFSIFDTIDKSIGIFGIYHDEDLKICNRQEGETQRNMLINEE